MMPRASASPQNEQGRQTQGKRCIPNNHKSSRRKLLTTNIPIQNNTYVYKYECIRWSPGDVSKCCVFCCGLVFHCLLLCSYVCLCLLLFVCCLLRVGRCLLFVSANTGKQQKTINNNRKQQKTIENIRKQPETTESHRKPKKTYNIRKH